MKINLTKLLESPTRVKWIKEPEPNTTAYYIEKEKVWTNLITQALKPAKG